MNTPVAGQVLVLFILMGMGFLSFKLKITTKEASAYFSSFVLKISLPCLVLHSFRHPFSRELLGEAATALGAALAVFSFSLLLAWLYPYILGIKGPERGVHRFAMVISNSGFIGFPVVEAVLGPFYLFHVSIFNVPGLILTFSVCSWFVGKEGGKAPAFSWKYFITPPFVCTIIGFIMFLFSIPLPAPVEQSLKLAGSMTTPLSMAVIGISIAQADMKQMFGRWRIYITVLIRLLFIPALAFLGCYLAGIRGPLLMLPVILTAMPAGTTVSLFAQVYDVAAEEAGSIVALSTILCAVTIPLVVIAVHYFGG
jgi:predicted permease